MVARPQGAQVTKSQFSVDFQLRTLQTKQPPQSSSKRNFFVRVRFGGVPSTVEKVVRVLFCCLFSWKTNAGNTGRTVPLHTTWLPNQTFRKRAEYGFGEYGFKHRTQWVFRDSLRSGKWTQWVPLSLLFVCKRELTEFLAKLTEFAAELSSEFSLPKQYSRNSIPPVS